MSDAVIIMGDLNDLTQRLDKAGKEIYRLQEEVDAVQDELEPVIVEYEEVSNNILTALIDEYEADEKRRLPGEDARNALVTRTLRINHPELYGKHKRLTADLNKKQRELKRKERLADKIDRQISSKQSSLKYLTTEARAIGA